jgi:predicted amidophosphoribosyltransferase
MKIIDQFSGLGISRQRKYQLRREAKGLCMQCGDKTEFGLKLCPACNRKNVKRMRKSNGCKSWKKGGCGRPPNSALARKIKKTVDAKIKKK